MIPGADPLGILRVLRQHTVPFVVIGGHAVIHHGYLRTTEDTDIVFRRSPAAESALTAALLELKACWISSEREPSTGLERLVPVDAAYVRAHHTLLLWTALGFLDVFDHIPGLPEDDVAQLFASAVQTDGIAFVALDWLIKLKRLSARPKDLDDLANLTD